MQTKITVKYDYLTIRIVQIIIKSNGTEFSKDARWLSLSGGMQNGTEPF